VPRVLRKWFWVPTLLSFSVLAEGGARFSCDTLVVSGNPEYPPLLWPSSRMPGHLTGAVPQLVREIAEPLGIRVEVLDVGTWARVQRQAELGEIDLVAGAFITSERIGYLDYVLPPMIHLETSVWVPKSHQFDYRYWPDLKGKQGSTLINNSFGERFDQYATDNLEIVAVRSIEQSFLMAQAGRVDYVLYEQLQGHVKLTRLGLADDFKPLEPAISREGLFFAFPKRSACNSEALREAFMARLSKLTDEGRLPVLVSEYANRYVDRER
jgi:polar amino acid transport system substrate-binding protein